MGDEKPSWQTMHTKLPAWLTRWFGVRSKPPSKKPFYVPYIWAFVGAFCGLSVIQAIFGQARYFIDRGVPEIVASYGASAVLCYSLPEAPLAQPRAVIGGHFLSGLTGVIVAKIFQLNDLADGDEPRLAWLAASIASSVAIVVMMATKTIHPPAGATALLPVQNAALNRLSWYYLPVLLLSSVILVVVAMITNNIQQRYPVFWWAPEKPKPVLPKTNDNALEVSASGETIV